MGKEREYFIDKDYNCAETTLRVSNDLLGLDLDERSLKLVSGFGGGMGAERTCGVLCAGISLLGLLLVRERAHEDPGFKEICAEFVRRFQEKLGSIECDELKAKYRTEEERCLKTVELGNDLLRDYLRELGIKI